VTSGIEGNIYSSGAGAVSEAPHFYGFVGRSSGGRRWRLDVFGSRTLGDNYRLSPGENTDVDAAAAVLRDVDFGIVGIDDLPVNVYTYTNVGANAYWQRELRT
jgi:hypothetical protein